MNNIVVNALAYYDKNTEKFEPMFKDAVYVLFPKDDSKGDIARRKILFMDKNKQELFKSNYEIIGIYENTTKTWTWAWSIPKLKKNVTYISRKILDYGLNIDIDESNVTNAFLKAELITGRFRISNQIQLDLHMGIASYLSHNPIVYKFVFYPEESTETFVKIRDEDPSKAYSAYYLFILDKPDSFQL